MLTAKEVFAWLDHVMVIQFESGEHHLSCQEAAQMPLQCGYSTLTCTPSFNLSHVVHSDSELDTQGLLCPEPLMLLRNRMRELDAGEILYVTASDPTTHRDFSNFCHFLGHELLVAEVEGEILQYWIKKGGA